MTDDKMQAAKTNDKVIEEIKKKVIGGKLPCATARQIAEKLGVSYREVGEAADMLHVKITSCQLGCF
jgi:DNA-binding FadR family transcriptional regulator